MNQETRQEFADCLKRITRAFDVVDAELCRQRDLIKQMTRERDDLNKRLQRFISVHTPPNENPDLLQFVVTIDKRAAFKTTTPFEVMLSEAMRGAVVELEKASK